MCSSSSVACYLADLSDIALIIRTPIQSTRRINSGLALVGAVVGGIFALPLLDGMCVLHEVTRSRYHCHARPSRSAGAARPSASRVR